MTPSVSGSAEASSADLSLVPLAVRLVSIHNIEATDDYAAIQGRFDAMVVLEGLTKRPELNSLMGLITSVKWVDGEPAERWGISLFDENSLYEQLHQCYLNYDHSPFDWRKVTLKEPVSVSRRCLCLLDIHKFADQFVNKYATLMLKPKG